MVGKTLPDQFVKREHPDTDRLAQTALGNIAAQFQRIVRKRCTHQFFDRRAGSLGGGNFQVVLGENMRQRRIGEDVGTVGGIAFGAHHNHTGRQHSWIGGRHKRRTAVGFEIVGAADFAPQAVVEHQVSRDIAYALFAQLALDGKQVFLIENGVAAARPIQVSVKRAVVYRTVAFKLGRPAVIAAEGFEGGKRGNEFHCGGGVDGDIRAVVNDDFSAVKLLDIYGDFVLRNATCIERVCGEGGEKQQQGGRCFGEIHR
ncbi:Uncharacterised protein [Neisseria meningitidis]|nr:Uncharacterised protein [Neisseria meningitidis]CWR10060.1 Uncharacterised protein [Neisseria meningitidis]CWT05465.1 Uncharacterised protein [Neisseria meningitidis]CWT66141.1 Uncharacterised protein [Neisseria meningitidis]